jgi:hypothetical protein
MKMNNNDNDNEFNAMNGNNLASVYGKITISCLWYEQIQFTDASFNPLRLVTIGKASNLKGKNININAKDVRNTASNITLQWLWCRYSHC